MRATNVDGPVAASTWPLAVNEEQGIAAFAVTCAAEALTSAVLADICAELAADCAAFAVDRALLAVIWALPAVATAEFDATSAVVASIVAVVAKSNAVLTALGVAAWVVEVLLVLELSWTAPGADVEALLIDIVCGIDALTLSGAVACRSEPRPEPGAANVTRP